MEINKLISDTGSYGIVGQTKKRPENSEPVQSQPVKDVRMDESTGEQLVRMVVEMAENNQSTNSTEYSVLKKGSIVDKYA